TSSMGLVLGGRGPVVLTGHADTSWVCLRGGEFSDLLREFCRGEGILQSFMLSDSPQQNGIAERRIGLVMEVARTSMIHAAAPHFLWPFAVLYGAHQLNLWHRVSLLETSPTLRWMGKVGDASVFRVWGSRAFVSDTCADKLSARAIPCDITFDKSVPFYRLFPYLSAPPPPPPLFLTPCPPPGAKSRGAEPEGAKSEGAGSGGAEPESVEPGGTAFEGAKSGGAEERGSTSSGGPAGAPPRLSPRPEPLSPQQLREWFAQRTRLRSGAAGVGVSAAGDTGAGGAGVTAGAGGLRAAGTGGVGGAGAGDPRGAVARGAGAVDSRAGAVDSGAGAGGTVRLRPYFVPLLQQVLGVLSSPDQSQPPLQPASPLPAPSPYTEQTGGLTERREPVSRPASPVRIGRRVPRPRPPPVPGTHAMALHPSSVPLRLPLPPPPESSLPALPDSESDRTRAASPTVSRLLATVITDPSFESTLASALVVELVDFAAACRLDYATDLVAKSESASPSSVGGVCALGMDVLEDRQEDFECLAAAVPRFASMLLAPEGDPDAPDIPTPRSYAEAITGPYSSHCQAAMDAEMASWKSTGTYIDPLPPSRANIVDGMWIFRVKQPPDSPPAFKARYVARGSRQRQGVDYFHTFSPTPKMTTLWVFLHVAAQRDYESDLLGFSTTFLQGSLHEEIWLGRPPGFTGSFSAGTQWRLQRPVYSLCQAPREWHDTLRTTLVALGFAPSTADPSLFLCTDTSLPPFYVNDLVFATAATEALTLVKSELQKRHTCTDLGPSITPLSTGHSLSAPPSDESIEPSGLYPELVGCLIYLMTCTRPDLAYPLSLLARYVALGRHRKVDWDAAKRVLRYLCSTSGMGLVLGGRGPVFLTGHADASWVDDSATQPRLPPVLYVDNKAMIALCQEQRLEPRTKHFALRYFLAQELQKRGQLRLAYVATRANTADIFTKALPPGDH
ncbi:unnamed protein product, partial [Closterium sp. NIES-54]